MRSNANYRPNNISLAIRNSTFSLLSLVSRLIGNMVIFIVIARLPGIDAAAFGQITYAAALASLFILFSQFGLLPLLIRDIATDHSLLHVYASCALSLRIGLSLLGMAALVGYVQFIGIDEQGREVCYIMAAALYIGSFSTDFQGLFQSQEQMHLDLLAIVSENAFLLMLALLAFLFHPTVVQIAYIFLLAKSLALAVNYLVCGRSLLWLYPKIDFRLWKRMLIEATPFALAALVAGGVILIDTLLLRELSPGDSGSAVGQYQAAVRLFLVPMLLPEIVLKVFLPQLSRMHGREGDGLIRDLGRVNNILLTLGLMIGLVTLFRGEDLIHLIYGAKYAEAGLLLQVLGVTIMMRFGAAYNLYFTIRNRIWFRVFSAILALAAVVVFDWMLIPQYGPMGAAYASVFAHVVYWIPYLVALYLAEHTVFLGWRVLAASIVGMVLALFLYVTSVFHITYMLPFYAVFGLLAVFFTMAGDDRVKIFSQLRSRVGVTHGGHVINFL